MNTSKLNKHYDALTAWERLPMIIAAAGREDEAERLRLMHSAPKATYQLPVHHGLSESLEQATVFHHMTLLDLAAVFWQLSSMLSEEPFFQKRTEAHRREQRLTKVLKLLCFRVVVLADAWKLFCAELGVDSVVLLRDLPGYDTVEQLMDLAPSVAFTPAEALAYLRESNKRGNEASPREYSLATAAEIARDMRAFLEERFNSWL